MKKLLFLIWLFPAVCMAQTDTAAVKSQIIYCRLYLESTGFKFRVKVDFGKKTSNLYGLDAEFDKLNGNLAELNNEIDGLNYMVLQGWELVTFASDHEVRSYLLRKKISK